MKMIETGNPLISIIIPVYNVEPYLKQCLDSILAQTYHNYEVILVDDGSTDRTGEICREYAQIDDRITSYHQKNAGQAAARNLGMERMKGEYVAFIDGDDYVACDYIKKMLETAIQYDADLVQGLEQKFWNDKKKRKLKKKQREIEQFNASEALREFCYQRRFRPGPCCKLIRVEVIKGIEFPVGKGYEDMAIMYRVIGNARKSVLIPEVLYFYRQHNNSTMHNSFSDKKVDRIRIAEELKEYIDTNFPENSEAVKVRYLLANLQLLMELPFDKKYKLMRYQIKNNIMNIRNAVIKNYNAKISIRIMAVFSYFGLPMLMCLGRIYNFFHRIGIINE